MEQTQPRETEETFPLTQEEEPESVPESVPGSEPTEGEHRVGEDGGYLNAGEEDAYGDADNPSKWGDSVLLVFPNGETMLIDAGMQDYGRYLVEKLKALGIEKLDCCMMSHQHADHYMGFTAADGILAEFSVGKLFYSGIYHGGMNSRAKLRVEKMAEFYGTELHTLARGDVVKFDDVTMTVISPEQGRVGESSDNVAEITNGDSLVVRFDYGGTSYLTGGDLYVSAESGKKQSTMHLTNITM